MPGYDEFRYFLKDSIRKIINFQEVDQSRGVPPPAHQKPCADNAKLIDLAPLEDLKEFGRITLFDAIRERKSVRRYDSRPLSMDELAFLLWATQGVKSVLGPHATLRTVPSAGARHSFETYLAAARVDGLKPGIYRYLPIDHKLLVVEENDAAPDLMTEACFSQGCVEEAAVTFAWTTVPYRMEWRYGLAAHRVIAIDAGHVCQNLYLAAEGINCGVCAIGAYDQEKVDEVLGVDGEDEFAIYLASVGKQR